MAKKKQSAVTEQLALCRDTLTELRRLHERLTHLEVELATVLRCVTETRMVPAVPQIVGPGCPPLEPAFQRPMPPMVRLTDG